VDPQPYDADPDATFNFDADPDYADPDPSFHFDADPDAYLAPHRSDANLLLLAFRPSKAPMLASTPPF
jgi:hypothetical protein